MVFALVGALGLVSVVAVDIMLTMQEVEAQKPRGCNRSVEPTQVKEDALGQVNHSSNIWTGGSGCDR